jgi:cytochrome b561
MDVFAGTIMTSTSTTRYDAVAMALHWIIAVILIFMLFFGGDLIRSRDGITLPALHATLGATVFILSLVRLAWRFINPPPELPATMTGWEQKASKAMAVLFYVLMIGLPLTGWLAMPSYVTRHPALGGLTFFGSISATGAPSLGFDAGGLHELMGNAGIALLGLHVLAALKHQFVDHDGVLRRMLPL